MTERIGLPEVRGYRIRQLEAEETGRMEELDRQRSLLPDLSPLLMISVESA
jgi:hypothetical protein